MFLYHLKLRSIQKFEVLVLIFYLDMFTTSRYFSNVTKYN